MTWSEPFELQDSLRLSCDGPVRIVWCYVSVVSVDDVSLGCSSGAGESLVTADSLSGTFDVGTVIANLPKEPLGVIGLIALGLGVLAYFFFGKDSLKARMAAFLLLFVAATSLCFALVEIYKDTVVRPDPQPQVNQTITAPVPAEDPIPAEKVVAGATTPAKPETHPAHVVDKPSGEDAIRPQLPVSPAEISATLFQVPWVQNKNVEYSGTAIIDLSLEGQAVQSKTFAFKFSEPERDQDYCDKAKFASEAPESGGRIAKFLVPPQFSRGNCVISLGVTGAKLGADTRTFKVKRDPVGLIETGLYVISDATCSIYIPISIKGLALDGDDQNVSVPCGPPRARREIF